MDMEDKLEPLPAGAELAALVTLPAMEAPRKDELLEDMLPPLLPKLQLPPPGAAHETFALVFCGRRKGTAAAKEKALAASAARLAVTAAAAAL